MRFQLDRYDGKVWDASQNKDVPVWTKIKDITTDKDGQVTLNKDSDNLSTNTCYRIVETNLGDNSNYALDTSKAYYFVWKGALNGNASPSNNDVWGNIKDNGILGDTIKNQTLFVTDSGTIYVPNKSTAVTVNKVWMDSDKNEITNPGKTATVRLYRQTATPDGYKVTIHIHTGYDGYDPYTIYVKKDTSVTVKIYNYGNATYNGTTFNSNWSNAEGKAIASVDLGTITSDINADITIGGGNAGGGYDTVYESADSYIYGEKEYIGANGNVVSDASSANVSLNSDNSYSNVWTGLEAADANGNEYSYHVEENPISGFTTTYSDNNAAGIQTGALTVYNTQTETPKGSLWIQKTGKYNGDADTDGKLNGDYTFKIKDSDGNVVKTVTVTLDKGAISKVSGDGTLDEETGKAIVSDLPEGTYTVTEDLTGKDGISLLGDNDVQVKVTADGTADTKTAAFVNNKLYVEQGLEVTKSITTTDGQWPKNQTFSFVLAADANNPEGATLPTDTTATATDAKKTATFGNIAFTKAGTYTFTITEQEPTTNKPSYITYDTKPKTVTVKVDEKDGKLSITSVKYDDDEADSLTVTNTYSASGNTTIKAYKVFTNGIITDGRFSFSLQKLKSDGSADGDAEIIVVDKDSKQASKDITYDAAGTYTYKLKEVLPDNTTVTGADKDAGYKIVDGIKYDLTEYTIVDTVTDNGDGTLTVTRTINGTKKMDSTAVDATFTNEQLGSLKLTKAVTMNGKPTTDAIANGTYKFTVSKGTDVSKTVEITIEGGQITKATVDGTDVTDSLVPEDNTKYVELTDLPIGEYTITETLPNGSKMTLSSVTVDGNPATITDTSATVTVSTAESKVVFNNNVNIFEFSKKWESNGTPTTWKGDIEVTLKGTTTGAGNEISAVYTITQSGDSFTATKKSGSAGLPVSGSYTGYSEYEYSFKFENLPAGYTYSMTETSKPNGYNEPVYTNGKSDGDRISTGGIITNSTGYALPGTGGSGLKRYMGIAALLMALGLVLYIKSHERRKKPS